MAPRGMDVGADGSVYIADFYNDVIRRVKPDGTMVIVAGRQRPRTTHPAATAATAAPRPRPICTCPSDVEVGAGRVAVHRRLRQPPHPQGRPEGTISTVAGRGDNLNQAVLGDGGPATQASIIYPGASRWLDGTLFISEGHLRGYRVRRVGPDGNVTTYAGGGNSTADNIQATSFNFNHHDNRIDAIDLDDAGNLYIASGGKS